MTTYSFRADCAFGRQFVGLLLFACQFLPLPAQVYRDDFSDGDHTADLSWAGDTDHFQVDAAGVLRLQAPVAGMSKLYVPVSIADSCRWRLWLLMDFDPSATNRLRIYLQADDADLAVADGYFLEIGQDGSEDAIRFFRQDAGVPVLLGQSAVGSVASRPMVRWEMQRTAAGRWTLYADLSGGYGPDPVLIVSDSTYMSGDAYFGWACSYSSTRRDKFRMDDFLLEPLLPDTVPPRLELVTSPFAREVELTFDEPLDLFHATDPSLYVVLPDIGPPTEVFAFSETPGRVLLALDSALANLQEYTVRVLGVRDTAGNQASVQQRTWRHVEISPAKPGGILINEIMADPTPAIALPAAEYLELVNPGGTVTDLSTLRVTIGNSVRSLPPYLLYPDRYVTLCDTAWADSFRLFGPTLGMSSFPTLSNEGTDLVLASADGQTVVDRLSYDIGMYGSAGKAEGGWSLERINPLSPCSGTSNWAASQSLSGGTPGRPNSVLEAVADTAGTRLLYVAGKPSDRHRIRLFFDRRLDAATVSDTGHWRIRPPLALSAAYLEDVAGQEGVTLLFQDAIQENVSYELAVGQAVTDCSGRPVEPGTVGIYVLPDSVQPGDLVINELLFNPQSGGVDFVEFHNRSGKVLNLGDLAIGNLRPAVDTSVVAIVSDRLLFPGSYLAVTADPSDLVIRYRLGDSSVLLKNELPAFGADRGNVTLYRSGPTGAAVIDALDYDADMHHPLLEDTKGVSLERRREDMPTQDPSNWQSAAAAVGYATPGYRNSQILDRNAPPGGCALASDHFTPDGDGADDILSALCRFEQGGYLVTAAVYDWDGRLVRRLDDNQLAGEQCLLKWEGETENGLPAQPGLYFLVIRAFHPDGAVFNSRMAVILSLVP
ncbi:MAG: hypothetical protein RLY31_2385 [Bacteroidota bacterium]